MKKFLIIISLLLMIGCSLDQNNDNIEKLSASDNNLPKSMKSYYEKNLNYKFEGELFEVKIDDILTIIPEGSEREYFNYHILVAPRTNQELIIKSVKLLPHDDLLEYFNFDLPPYNGFKAVDTLLKSPDTDIKYNKPSDFNAIEYNAIVDNNGNDNIKKSGLSKNDFDDLMKNIKLEIKYTIKNKESVEVIPLKINETVIVDSKEIANNYSLEIQNVFNNNEVINSYGVLD